jgi:hypothetical protein
LDLGGKKKKGKKGKGRHIAQFAPFPSTAAPSARPNRGINWGRRGELELYANWTSVFLPFSVCCSQIGLSECSKGQFSTEDYWIGLQSFFGPAAAGGIIPSEFMDLRGEPNESQKEEGEIDNWIWSGDLRGFIGYIMCFWRKEIWPSSTFFFAFLFLHFLSKFCLPPLF